MKHTHGDTKNTVFVFVFRVKYTETAKDTQKHEDARAAFQIYNVGFKI